MKFEDLTPDVRGDRRSGDAARLIHDLCRILPPVREPSLTPAGLVHAKQLDR